MLIAGLRTGFLTLGRPQRLVQVRLDILYVLEPNAEADVIRGHTGFGLLTSA